MNLLEEDKKNTEKTANQKLVLSLLIISVVLSVIIIMLLLVLPKEQKTIKYSILINGEEVSTTEIGLIQDESNIIYIPLKTLANKVGYKYYNGEFRIAGEDKDKGYIDNGMCIIQFFADSNKIYKTEENSSLDYQYYELEHNILDIDNVLYIALEDLSVGLNLVNNYYEENNQSIIQTVQYIIEQNTENFKEEGLSFSDIAENTRAMAYGYIIVEKEGKKGVFDLQGEEIIGAKYNSVTFIENAQSFIVSNTSDKFGIITEESKTKIDLQYDSIEILNYNPMLYKVEKLDKYGIVKEDGTILCEAQYDSIGYPENKEKEISYTLIIPELNDNIQKSIVVCKDKKYGLIDFENGEEILECTLNAIYSMERSNEVYYIVEIETGKEAFLGNYINELNKITVNM